MRKILGFLFAGLLLLLMAQPVLGAYSLRDNIYLSLPNGTIECINILLPDDIGIIVPEKIDYKVEVEPSPLYTWGDVSEELHAADPNNTVKTRICFNTFNKEIGDCGQSFTLTISAEELPSRTVKGGVCVSKHRDIETSPALEGQNVSDVINSRKDTFDMALSKEMIFAEPGSTAAFTLSVQSYANIGIGVRVEGDDITPIPEGKTLSFTPTSPKQTFDFSIEAPTQEAEYFFTVRARIRECLGIHCEKEVYGRVVVEDEPPEETGWTVSIFPESINVKDLQPVDYEVTVTNNGPQESFSVDVYSSAETDFTPTTLDIPEGGSESVSFRVTPPEVSTLYEVLAEVTSAGQTKSESAYLNTNEMLTDAMRETDEVKDMAPGEARNLDNSLDDFIDSYKDSPYGEEFESYGNLKDSLDDAREKAAAEAQQPQPTLPPAVIGEPQPTGGFDFTLIIIGVVIAAVVGVALFFYKKKQAGGGGGEEAAPGFEEY